MKKIMVVDDERVILDMLIDVLTHEGCSVVTAEDGRQALDLLPEEQPDVMLIDMVMPRMTGDEVLSRMSRLGAVRGTPVILMSGSERPDLHNYPRCAFLAKPMNIGQLLATIERMLVKSDAAQGNGSPWK